MNLLFTISCLLAALASILPGILVFFKKRDIVGRTWFTLSIAVCLWSLGLGLMTISKDKFVAFGWCRVHYFGCLLIPAAYFHFITSLLKIHKERRFHVVLGYLMFIILVTLSFMNLIIKDVTPKMVFNYYTVPAVLYPLFPLFYTVYISYAFVLAIQYYRKATTNSILKNQIKYIIFASLIGFLGGTSTFLPVFNINLYPWGMFIVFLYPLIITYAIIKHRLMDIRLVITRAGIALVVYCFFFGIPFYWGYKTNSWLLSTSAAVVLAIPVPLIYRYFTAKAEEVLLAQQRRYQKILLQAGAGMVREHNLDRLLKLIVYVVKRIVGIKFAAGFTHNRENDTYVLKAARDHKLFSQNIVLNGSEPLIMYLRANPFPMTFQEIPYNVRVPLEESIGARFDLIVPSATDDEVLGFLVLGEKQDRSPYSQDDINVFKILSHQASLAIENCIFFDEFKKVQERIFNAEKLASIGGMADGVAHQIKNRLNHFSLASGKMKIEINKFLKSNPCALQDPNYAALFQSLLETTQSLISNVQRTNSVIKGILDYARTQEKDIYFGYFSLTEILHYAIDLIKVKHSLTNPPIQLTLDQNADTIYGIKSQIMEVLFNLIDNAYEATQERKNTQKEEHYAPQITITSSQDDKNHYIAVTDNGIGIKDNAKLKLFAPFYTTKSSEKKTAAIASGSGIGMYIIKRLIKEHHGGRVTFESEYLKGTTFLIQLPKGATRDDEEKL